MKRCLFYVLSIFAIIGLTSCSKTELPPYKFRITNETGIKIDKVDIYFGNGEHFTINRNLNHNSSYMVNLLKDNPAHKNFKYKRGENYPQYSTFHVDSVNKIFAYGITDKDGIGGRFSKNDIRLSFNLVKTKGSQERPNSLLNRTVTITSEDEEPIVWLLINAEIESPYSIEISHYDSLGVIVQDDGRYDRMPVPEMLFIQLPSIQGEFNICIDDGTQRFTRYAISHERGLKIVFTQEDKNPWMIVKNETEFPIVSVALKASQTNDWVMRSLEIIAVSEEKEIAFPTSTNYDIRFLNDKGDYYSKYNIPPDKGIEVIISHEDKHPWVIIENNTQKHYNRGTVRYRKTGTSNWIELDRNKTPIRFQVTDKQSPTFDFRITCYDNSIGAYRSYTKTAIKISDNTVISFTSQDGDPALTIVNNVGNFFDPLFIKRSEDSDWGPNRHQLLTWKSLTLTLLNGEPFNGKYDIWAEEDGSFYRKLNVDVTKDVTATFTIADRLPEVTIKNQTGRPIVRVYRRLSSDTDWGKNLITSTLANGKSIQSKFRNRRNDKYDFRIEDDLSNVYVRLNIDISRDVTLNFTSADKQ